MGGRIFAGGVSKHCQTAMQENSCFLALSKITRLVRMVCWPSSRMRENALCVRLDTNGRKLTSVVYPQSKGIRRTSYFSP